MNPRVHSSGIVELKESRSGEPENARADQLLSAGTALAARLSWVPGRESGDLFADRTRDLQAKLNAVLERTSAHSNGNGARKPQTDSTDVRSVELAWLRDNSDQLSSAATQLARDLNSLTDLPVVVCEGAMTPRVLALAQNFVAAAGVTFSKGEFASFCGGFQQTTPLQFHEIGVLIRALVHVVLEHIAELGLHLTETKTLEPHERITTSVQSYRYVTQTSWKDELESLIAFENILNQDPAGAYPFMDRESRSMYREEVASIAARSDHSETQVAETALSLARRAKQWRNSDERIARRESHIGYYLVGDGRESLAREVAFHPTTGERFRAMLRSHPDEVFLPGVAVLTLAIVACAIWFLTPANTSLVQVLVYMVILLLPASQSAVEMMNYLITNILPAKALPKLDFSNGIPADCVTMVAVPVLLLHEEQVHKLVDALEVRFLGNHDPNLHFAIVSDLSDSQHSPSEEDALVSLCSRLIEQLNQKYAGRNSSSFFHLHRHRVYNPRERRWMGWERKRGKLLDLNQLLRGHYDSFPVKTGDLSILPTIRYVITLDADTELPRECAHRMIGAIAHPLNQAIVDPGSKVVVAGYGILQPRVGISVRSTSRSRLASIFAGETGLDPYTRAVSDVYQDLYGEGTFTGKGIYEVDTLLEVLKGRFPRNSLLSHDLIEGAYARVGLITDVEVIEDYPTHYSAYNRRKHRWLRGDWQIIEWLLGRVPDESGARVANPISLVSRWKILDNLRRSLVEPATFALLLCCWLNMNRPILWTIAAVCILFVPSCLDLVFGLSRAAITRRGRVARESFTMLFESSFAVLLALTLLGYQTLLSIDAVARALVRRLITHRHLLEWETAAESEAGGRTTAIDRYIEWMPFLATGLGLTIWITRPHALFAAVPILMLWACSKPLALWLNKCPIPPRAELSPSEEAFLRRSALYTWRYFAELSNEVHHWLVPDNFDERQSKIAAAVSPTNIGLLLNARQASHEFGYITVPEFVQLSQKTLCTVDKLPKYRGHLMNWYDTHTLTAKPPFFISSVDSGNLVASLWTLSQGCLDCLRRPLIPRTLADGLLDHVRALVREGALSKRALSDVEEELRGEQWLCGLLHFQEDLFDRKPSRRKHNAHDIAWFRQQGRQRVRSVQALVRDFVPWLLPEFAPLQAKLREGADGAVHRSLQELPEVIEGLEAWLESLTTTSLNGDRPIVDRLRLLLQRAHRNALQLIATIRETSDTAQELAEAMDFTFLLDKRRLLLSVGFDAKSEELAPYCYDLLATEPRTAVFVAIAKEDIPQECWFRLDRPVVSDHGHPVLLSWTGTMFEYLMPSIWMRTYPNTLLDTGTRAAVRSQQAYAEKKAIPWGISESACSRRNDAGDYHYEAFGVPALARKKGDFDPLIVSPYSTLLALNVDRERSLANLRRLNSLGQFGSYGFYEAADYTNSRRRFLARRFEIVRSWMAHHQGMSLLALANCLCDHVFQRWFHSDPRVQATELLLQEKPTLAKAA